MSCYIMDSVFVTGGTGFVGNYLLKYLISEGFEVHLLCRKNSTYKIPKRYRSRINIVYGDLCDKNSYTSILDKVKYVIHFAAIFQLEAKEVDLWKVNIEGTNEILEACTNKKNIKKIIYCSTAGVYSFTNEQIDETSATGVFLGTHRYEESKFQAEKICQNYRRQYGLPIIIIRPTAIYGKGSTYFFSTIFNFIKNGKTKFYLGTGDNLIHMVHVEDITRATLHLLKKGKIGEIYNICDDHPLTMRQALDYILENLDMEKPKMSIPPSIAQFFLPFLGISREMFVHMQEHRHFSNKKLKNTGFKFKYPDFRLGIKKFINESKDKPLQTSH